MLQIKNTLGGGKPEGLYAWSKRVVTEESVEEITNHTTNITLDDPAGGYVYYASSYTYDESTGLYTLVNPTQVGPVPTNNTMSLGQGQYFMYDKTSAEVMYGASTSGRTDYKTLIKEVNGVITIIPLSSSYPTRKYEYVMKEINSDTITDYIVSDKESAYPNGARHTDGYYYEKIIDIAKMFGCTKMAIDSVTFASDQDFIVGDVKYYLPHSLGEIPKHAILWAQTDITTYVYPGYLQGFDIRKNAGLNAYVCVNWLIESNNSFTGQTRMASLTADNIYINGGVFKAGVEYKLITMV